MKKAKFWVDWLLEAGEDSICHRYWFEMEIPDAEYEELYQVWYDNNCQLNSWGSDWKGHDELFEIINACAYHILNDELKKHEPEFADPLDVYWEISKETVDAF